MALNAKILHKKKGLKLNLGLNHNPHNKYEELNFGAA